MENLEKMMEKIKNLLDLANNNPNEHEALAAALKAQELMAKYHIEMADISDRSDDEEMYEAMYEDSGKHEMKKWKNGLAAVISQNFCCKYYILDMGSRKNIIFYGYKKDAKIALEVFKFLYEVGNKFAVRYYNKCKKEGRDTRGVMNTYLIGFRDGIKEVLGKQCTALMIITPKEVEDSFAEMSKNWKRSSQTIRSAHDPRAYDQGKRDGKDTIAARTLESA